MPKDGGTNIASPVAFFSLGRINEALAGEQITENAVVDDAVRSFASS